MNKRSPALMHRLGCLALAFACWSAIARAVETELSATLVDPHNIVLKWKSDATVEGYLVEYTSDPEEDYIILTIVPPSITTFHHPDLGPSTRFVYRIRPFFGRASEVVRITTEKVPAGTEPKIVGDDEPLLDTSDAATKKKSLRDPATATAAVPAELTATLAAPVSVALRWKDCANDEDGYLVEGAAEEQTMFQTIAFLPPDTVGFTIPQLPDDTTCELRVRAFYYGESSNVVEKTTGSGPRRQFGSGIMRATDTP